VAHNIDGFQNIFHFLKTCLPVYKISIIAGLAKDKDYLKIAEIISNNVYRVGIVRNFSDRALPADILKNALKIKDQKIQEFEYIDQAYLTLRNDLASNELLLIIGSHYLAGEFLKKYKNIDFR
jgi:dihydrofolate synthase/folylpolyglutamate synthase